MPTGSIWQSHYGPRTIHGIQQMLSKHQFRGKTVVFSIELSSVTRGYHHESMRDDGIAAVRVSYET